MTNEQTETSVAAQTEPWLTLCEQLQQRIESLSEDNTALRTLLAASEQQAERLSAIVDAEAEDLQQFGSHWFRPSAVVSVTRDNSAGILINGNPIGWEGSAMRGDSTYQQMQVIAEEINRQNAEQRARAREK